MHMWGNSVEECKACKNIFRDNHFSLCKNLTYLDYKLKLSIPTILSIIYLLRNNITKKNNTVDVILPL